MSRLLEWFEVTPFVQKVSLIGLFIVMCGVGFYWLIAEPIMEETNGLRVEIQNLDAKLKLYTDPGRQYSLAKEELSRWESLMSKQKDRLGLEVPMSQVLSDMSNIAQETGIILTLWKPDEPEMMESNRSKARHLQLHVEGGYHNVARFLEGTQYLSKMMGVTAITMQSADGGDGISTVRTTVVFLGYEGNAETIVSNREDPVISKPMERKG